MTTTTNVRDIIAGRRYRIPASAGWLSRFAPKARRDAYVKQAARVEEARELSTVRNADPRVSDADKHAAKVALLDELSKMEELSDGLVAWREANVELVSDEVRARRIEIATLALATLDDLEVLLREEAETARALALFRNDHPAKRDASVSSSKRLRIAGGDSLSNLRRGLEALLPKDPVELVSSAEYRRREEVGEDVSGLRISFGRLGSAPTGRGLG
jgi:hypothetical protein